METEEKKNIPIRRFPEFLNDGEWEVKRLGEISISFSGGTPSASNKDYYGGTIPFIRSGEINSDHTELFLTQEGLDNSSAKIVERGTILYALYGATSGEVGIARLRGAINQAILAIIPNEEYDSLFIYHYLKSQKESIINRYLQGGQGNLSGAIINALTIPVPSFAEQQRIAACLSAADEMIVSTNGKLEQLKAYKKGLMQKLFPAKDKKLPELRFKEFEKDGEWEEKKYEDCLDYEQPQSYLVSSENYKKTGVPVLTAGKTFILGFTDETFGVYTKLPVIIFDDFTTDSRFVGFPFKAKSSAMKMLSVKEGYDLRFIFATMQNNEFKPHDHQRHWISIYSKFKVEIPSLAEQRKIAGCLTSIDDMINQYTNKVALLELYKKGLMQQMFPSSK